MSNHSHGCSCRLGTWKTCVQYQDLVPPLFNVIFSFNRITFSAFWPFFSVRVCHLISFFERLIYRFTCTDVSVPLSSPLLSARKRKICNHDSLTFILYDNAKYWFSFISLLIFFTEYTWHIPFIKPKKASACVEDDLATVGVNEEEAVNWKM